MFASFCNRPIAHNLFNTHQTFENGSGERSAYYSLPKLQTEGIGNISRLPQSIRIVGQSAVCFALASALNHCCNVSAGARGRGLPTWRRMVHSPYDMSSPGSRIVLYQGRGFWHPVLPLDPDWPIQTIQDDLFETCGSTRETFVKDTT